MPNTLMISKELFQWFFLLIGKDDEAICGNQPFFLQTSCINSCFYMTNEYLLFQYNLKYDFSESVKDGHYCLRTYETCFCCTYQ